MIKKEIRIKVWNKFGQCCAYCGCSLEYKDMQVDHAIPQLEFAMYVKNKFRIPDFLKHLTENDINHEDNLMPACRVCNKWKDAFPLETFRMEIFEQLKRLEGISSNYRMAKKYGLIQETPKPIVFYFENPEN